MKSSILYLAGPYTKGSAAARDARFHALTTTAAKLIKQGHIVYSPITMTHPIDRVLAYDGQTLGSDFWVAFDEAFMAACSSIYVLRLPGWDESSGVKRELAFFAERGILPQFLDPADIGIDHHDERFKAAFVGD
jgi:hypothetical protein